MNCYYHDITLQPRTPDGIVLEPFLNIFLYSSEAPQKSAWQVCFDFIYNNFILNKEINQNDFSFFVFFKIVFDNIFNQRKISYILFKASLSRKHFAILLVTHIFDNILKHKYLKTMPSINHKSAAVIKISFYRNKNRWILIKNE